MGRPIRKNDPWQLSERYDEHSVIDPDTGGQCHQHVYAQLLLAQMLWRIISVSPTILCLTLPVESIRSYA